MSLSYSNTAMICYNCSRVAMVRLRLILSHTDRSPVIPAVELSQALDILDVFFVSCAMCLELSGVYNPRKS